MNYGEFINELNVLFPETTPEMAEKFRAMEGLYNDWNAKINVISRKDIGMGQVLPPPFPVSMSQCLASHRDLLLLAYN